MTFARFKVDLTCFCGTQVYGCQVMMKKEGSAPLLCPRCGASFVLSSLAETPTTFIVDPRDEENPVRLAVPKDEPS
jgi:hypothetical protein